MTKKLLCIMLTVLTALAACAATKTTEASVAMALAKRLSPRLAQKVEFRQVSADTSADFFTLSNRGGKVLITGNNANSMAVGLNRYLRRYCKTTVSWYGDIDVDLPQVLPAVEEDESVMSRVPERFFLNYCTFGYTMPFWGWKHWERFIDWMALNGINMPLAITGQESVWLKVWQKFGMTPDEIRAYFTGPVYLPWHRMSNVDAWCGPLPQEWLDGQEQLQKQILKRERELNMRPVLPAFAGHVPARIKEMNPNADIKQLSVWDDFDGIYRPYFLQSNDPLYAKIQKAFIEEQTKLYGTDHIYGLDLFNEMDPPSLDPDYLHNLTKHIYESLTAADPKAEWLHMGWFLYYQRKDFTEERTHAMLTGVPIGKMQMLDYFCEAKEVWRMRNKFSGQPYIWCYLGNFGGNTALQGNPKKSGQRIDKALKEGGKNLVGIGSTLEGLDVQQFPFEHIFDKAWSFTDTTSVETAQEVADRHAGYVCQPVRDAWQILYDRVLTTSTGTRRSTQAAARPELLKRDDRHCKPNFDRGALLQAWKLLLQQPRVATDAMRVDMVWTGRQLLGDMFYDVKAEFDSAMVRRDVPQMQAKAALMQSLLADIDTLSGAQPYCTVGKWIEIARNLGVSPEIKDYYEMNARRIVTTWGGDLNDYALRLWGGLVGNYQAKRWKLYTDEGIRSVQAGESYNDKDRLAATEAIEQSFATDKTPVPQPECPDVLAFSRHLAQKYFK